MKKIKFSVFFAILFTFMLSAFFVDYSDVANSQLLAENMQADYNSQIIAQTEISDEVVNYALSSEGVTTMYNLVVFVRFNDQAEFTTKSFTKNGVTNSYLQIIDAAYNTSKYSLRNYYLTVSGGKLDIQTIYLFANGTNSSFQITKYNIGYFLANSSLYASDTTSPEYKGNYINTIGYKTDAEKSTRTNELINLWTSQVQNAFNSNIKLTNLNGTQNFDYSVLDNMDNDGNIDTLTVLYSPQTTENYLGLEWAGPLWSFQTGIANRITISSASLKSYKYAQIMMDFYHLATITESGNKYIFTSSSTITHEMGHVLGLLDLYYYGDQNGTIYGDVPVGTWSGMAFNSTLCAQLFTSYEREYMGWLDDSNVKTISRKGSYTLDVAKGGTDEGIVAYKIPLDGTGKKYVYLEYRNNAKDSPSAFDANVKPIFVDDNGTTYYTGVYKSGLLVYVIDESNGTPVANEYRNYTPKPESIAWGIEVMTNYTYANDQYKEKAALAVGETLGKTGTAGTGTIYYISAAGKKTNSGLVVTVTELDSNTLTFSISGGSLTSEGITKTQIGNDKLYKRLIEISGDSSIDKNSFKTKTYLDLSNCDITDLSFLNLFDFTNLKYLNLFGNNIAFDTTLATTVYQFNSKYPNVKVYMAGNKVDLSMLAASASFKTMVLNNANIYWGIQNIESLTTFDGTDLDYIYHINSAFGTGFSLSLNGQALQSEAGEIATMTLTAGQKHIVKFTADFDGESFEREVEITLVEISTDYTQDNPYIVYQTSIDKSALYSAFNISPKIDGLTVNVDTSVLATLQDGNVHEVNVEFYFNGTKVAEKSIYAKLKMPEQLNQNDFDSHFYSVLLSKFNLTALYDNTFAAYDVLDLSSLNLTSVKGIELFTFKSGAKINLAENKLSDKTEILNLLQNENLAKVVLILNNFSSEVQEEIKLSTFGAKTIFALQNTKTLVLSGNPYTVIRLAVDYEEYFTLSITKTGALQTTSSSDKTLYTYTGTGTVTFEFVAKSDFDNIAFTAILARIALKSEYTQINLQVGTPFEFNKSWFDTTYQNFTDIMTTNLQEIDFSTLGQKTVVYTFNNGDSGNYELRQTVVVEDKIAPEITLVGSPVVYLDVNDVANYIDAGVTAKDNYDGTLSSQNIEVDSTLVSQIGRYVITYTAKDSSNNIVSTTRTIVVGNVSANQNDFRISVRNHIKFPLVFNGFNSSDFDYVVTLNGNVLDYNQSKGLLLDDIGTKTYLVTVTDNVSNTTNYTFNFIVTVYDETAPIIILSSETVTLYEGESYLEAGLSYSDNSTEGNYTIEKTTPKLIVKIEYKDENNQKLTTLADLKVGTYYVVYTITDLSGNAATKTKTVYVRPKYVTKAEINENAMLPRYEAGSNVTIKLDLLSNSDILTSMPEVLWYINGSLVQTANSDTLTYKFTKKGEYQVSAVVTNYDKMGGSSKVYSNTITLEIYNTNALTKPIIFIALGAIVLAAALFVVYFVKKYRSRNFY